jgi:hypothetical protein
MRTRFRWDELGSQSVDQMFTNDSRSLDEGYEVVHTGSFSSGSSDTESSEALDTEQGPIGENSDV